MYTNRENRPSPFLPSQEKHSSLQKNTLNLPSAPEQPVPIKNPRNSTYSTKFHFLISPVHQTHFHLPDPHSPPQVPATTPFALFPGHSFVISAWSFVIPPRYCTPATSHVTSPFLAP